MDFSDVPAKHSAMCILTPRSGLRLPHYCFIIATGYIFILPHEAALSSIPEETIYTVPSEMALLPSSNTSFKPQCSLILRHRIQAPHQI